MGCCGGIRKDADAQRERMMLPRWRNKPVWTKNSMGGRKEGAENDPLYLKQPRAMVESSLLGIWFAEGRGWGFAHKPNNALVVLSTAFPTSLVPQHTCKRGKPVVPITEMGDQGEMTG